MDGSNGIYIMMPIVALVFVAILVVLPFAVSKEPTGRRSGRGHSLGHQAQGQVASQSAAAGSDAIGPGDV